MTAETGDQNTQTVPSAAVIELYTATKPYWLDRWLDIAVEASGSQPVFMLILVALLTWAFLGIRFGQDTDWQVIISDVQAIIGYVFDSLLMRQQLNAYKQHLKISARLISRARGTKRMLRELGKDVRCKKITPRESGDVQQTTTFPSELPSESFVGRVSTLASNIAGHIVTCTLFWLCILIWIGFGSYCHWSVNWQLYINSGTSGLMVLIFAFLANIRERHEKYAKECLGRLDKVDGSLELKLREMTGNLLPNEIITVPSIKLRGIQRGIFYYANVVGTLTGIALLIIVMIVWVCIGPAMRFDSNWWLIIGTYAGLIGMQDGFVLRNIQMRFDEHVISTFGDVELEDVDIYENTPDLPLPKDDYEQQDVSLSCRISLGIGRICSHEWAVILGLLTIVGLLTGSTVMEWSTTGQLLCNIPPSIIESFLMMILITGHNIADQRRRVNFHNMYVRRLKLVWYVERLSEGGMEQKEVAANVSQDTATVT